MTRILLILAVVTAARHESRTGEADAAGLAALIDWLVETRLQVEHVRPADPADDAEFLRRVYLDLHGLVPVAEQVARFLADTRPDRRALLIDALLTDPRYGEYLADILAGATLSRHWENQF